MFLYDCSFLSKLLFWFSCLFGILRWYRGYPSINFLFIILCLWTDINQVETTNVIKVLTMATKLWVNFKYSVQFSSVAQSCLHLCYPVNHSTPDLPVHHQLQEFTQTHVHWVDDAIQPSHPLSFSSPPAIHLSQH